MSNKYNWEYEKLKKELDKIRLDYNRAKRLLWNVEIFWIWEFANKYKDWQNILEDEESWVDAVLNQMTESKDEIIRQEWISKKLVDEIKDNLISVKENISDMQTSYEKFLQIQWKIEWADSNISNLLDNSKQLKNDIDKVKEQSESILNNIKELFSTAQEQIKNMQEAYQRFLEIRWKIEDEKTGLSAIFDNVNTLYKKSQWLYSELQGFRDEGNKLLENIKDNKNKSDSIRSRISDVFDESKKISDAKIEEIKKVTSLITDTWFANSFHKQAKKLDRWRMFWGAVIIWTTFWLVYVLFWLFVSQDYETWEKMLLDLNMSAVFYRLSLTSPFLFLIWFAVNQYWRDTKLNDKYEFKAATASAISHHIDFLKKEFPKSNDIILDFAKDTFSKIYKEPYKDDVDIKKIEDLKKQIEEIKNNNKNDDKIMNIDKILKSAKELKELFPDNDNLKELLSILNSIIK